MLPNCCMCFELHHAQITTCKPVLMRRSEMDQARSSTLSSLTCNGFRLVFRFKMGVSVIVTYPLWQVLPSWLQPLVGTYESHCSILHRSLASFIDIQLLSDSSVVDALAIWRARSDTERPVEDEAGNKERKDNASIQVGKDILMANSKDSYNKARVLAVTALHSGDWLLALLISSWMTRLSECQLASGYAAGSESPMNVFVARLLTQWAAMQSLANTALDALLAINL